jgi:hypothetical protein
VRDENQHPAAVNVTNTTSFDHYDCTVTAVPDRPGTTAAISVGADWSNDPVPLATRVLRSGQTTTVDIVIEWEGARSETGILRFVVHDQDADSWTIEAEVAFPAPPQARWV